MTVSSKDYRPFQIAPKLYTGCPPWMRRATYAVIALGISSLVVANLAGVQTSTDTLVGTRATAIIGGLGLVAFSVLFAQIYSAFTLRQHS